MYDPILRARGIALEQFEGRSVEDEEIAREAMDALLDAFDDIITGHAGEITFNDETGTLKIIGDKNS